MCHLTRILTVCFDNCVGAKRVEYELAYDKTYNKTCGTSENSDQPAHLRSLIRVFTDCMCLLQPPGYPKRDKQEPLLY